jgi:hypothetical protein
LGGEAVRGKIHGDSIPKEGKEGAPPLVGKTGHAIPGREQEKVEGPDTTKTC